MNKSYSRTLHAAAFGSLLLAAGFSAYAEGDALVQLANQATISWTDFVDGVNDPTTVKGTLADNDPAKLAVTEAEGKVTEAQEAVTAAEGKVTEAQAKLAEDGELITAQKAAEATVTEKQNDLTTQENNLAKASQNLTKLNTEKGNLDSQMTTAQADLTQATSAYTTAQGKLGKLDKITTTTTKPLGWLNDIYQDAKAFGEAYREDSQTSDASIYYTYTTSRNNNTLYIAFSKTAPTWVPSGNKIPWTPATQSQFYDAIEGEGSIGVAYVNVYLGDDYKAISGSECLSVGNYQGVKGYVVSMAVQAVADLTSNSDYKTSTTTTSYSEDDQKLADQYEADMEKAEADMATANATIAKIKAQLNGGTVDGTEYTGVVNDINDTQTQIDTLNDTTIPNAKTAVEEAQKVKDTADAAVKAAQDDVTLAQNGVTEAKAAVTDAENGVKTAEANLAAAQAAADAKAFENYQEITLLGDVTVDKTITGAYSGIIDGDNHIISVVDGVNYAFNRFTGTLANAAINGRFANISAGASFSDVVAWRGEGQTNTFYPEVGNPTTYASLGALGYAVRNEYGVDFSTSQLVTLDDATKVYNITVNTSADVNTQAYVVVNKNGKLIGSNNQEVVIPANTFAKSEDVLAFDNVYYLEGNNYVCPNVVITDKVNFYCPENINAGSVEYTREFSEGLNAVTLPFAVSESNFEEGKVLALSTYDRETPEKFYFTIQSNAIPANTPMILVGAEGSGNFGFDNIENVTISKTTANIVEFEGSTEDKSKCYGNFVKANRQMFVGASQDYKVYGLNGGKFQAAGANATFSPFRLALTSEIVASESEAQKAPRSIAFLDEKGVEVGDLLTGIKDVAAEEETAFGVVAGQGEIIFTSDVEFGKVEIFSLDGKVAAVANVTEGTTSVNLQKGLYIVMGKKLVVR